METEVNYTLVGGFVIFLVISIILGIIWLSSGFSFDRYTTYAIYMQESVSGLNISSSVEYNGVEVGSVKNIELNQKDPKLVELLLSIKNNTPIIKTSPSLFVRLETALALVSKNFQKVTESIQAVLDKENILAIKNTIRHLDQVTQTLANNNYKLDSILKNTEKATRQFGPLLQSSMSTMKILEEQTLPSVSQLLSRLDQITLTLSQVSTEIKQNPSVLIRGKELGRLGPGENK
jgi:phospholipid/cholesterol/gamma-HCH transport system substrate-binding protein